MTDQSTHARELLVRILKDPASLDMSNWYVQQACGTTACAAGHSALLMGWTPIPLPNTNRIDMFFNPERTVIRTAASLGQEFLDLDDDTAYELFHNTSRLPLINILDRAAQGEEITQEMMEDECDVWEEHPWGRADNDAAFFEAVSHLAPRYLTQDEIDSLELIPRRM